MGTTLRSIGLAMLIVVSGVHAADAQSADERPAAAGKAQKKGGKSAKPAKGGKADTGGASDEQIADQLKAFCVKWMGFLETRETDNKKGIKWDKEPSRVSGHYVGYSKDY